MNSPLRQKVENLLGRCKCSVGCQEHVDVGGLKLPRVACQGLHQLLQCPGLHEPDPDGLPLQVGDVVLVVVIDGPGWCVVPHLFEVNCVNTAINLLLAP